MTKMFVSKRQIMSIEEFMENYVGKAYDGNSKLTHREMINYLYEKGIKVPEKVCFDYVSKESVLNGTHILVKDRASQILAYSNPRLKSFDSLLEELRTEANLVAVSKNRRKILKEIGVNVDVFENYENEEEIYPMEKQNRHKQFVKRRNNLYRKVNY